MGCSLKNIKIKNIYIFRTEAEALSRLKGMSNREGRIGDGDKGRTEQSQGKYSSWD